MKRQDENPITFNIGGQILTADQLEKSAPKKAARKSSDGPKARHDGWRVLGHAPGAMEAAKESRERELARWAHMSESSRVKARASGEREPKPWDEDLWRRKTKKSRVRSKPYEIPEAADMCAEMARAGGWLDVEIEEVKRGELAEAPGLV